MEKITYWDLRHSKSDDVSIGVITSFSGKREESMLAVLADFCAKRAMTVIHNYVLRYWSVMKEIIVLEDDLEENYDLV